MQQFCQLRGTTVTNVPQFGHMKVLNSRAFHFSQQRDLSIYLSLYCCIPDAYATLVVGRKRQKQHVAVENQLWTLQRVLKL